MSAPAENAASPAPVNIDDADGRVAVEVHSDAPEFEPAVIADRVALTRTVEGDGGYAILDGYENVVGHVVLSPALGLSRRGL